MESVFSYMAQRGDQSDHRDSLVLCTVCLLTSYHLLVVIDVPSAGWLGKVHLLL